MTFTEKAGVPALGNYVRDLRAEGARHAHDLIRPSQIQLRTSLMHAKTSVACSGKAALTLRRRVRV